MDEKGCALSAAVIDGNFHDREAVRVAVIRVGASLQKQTDAARASTGHGRCQRTVAKRIGQVNGCAWHPSVEKDLNTVTVAEEASNEQRGRAQPIGCRWMPPVDGLFARCGAKHLGKPGCLPAMRQVPHHGGKPLGRT